MVMIAGNPTMTVLKAKVMFNNSSRGVFPDSAFSGTTGSVTFTNTTGVGIPLIGTVKQAGRTLVVNGDSPITLKPGIYGIKMSID